VSTTCKNGKFFLITISARFLLKYGVAFSLFGIFNADPKPCHHCEARAAGEAIFKGPEAYRFKHL
jgi:hypothetical protein